MLGLINISYGSYLLFSLNFCSHKLQYRAIIESMPFKSMLPSSSADLKDDENSNAKIIAHITDCTIYHMKYSANSGVRLLKAKITEKLRLSHLYGAYSVGYFDQYQNLLYITDDDDLKEFQWVQNHEHKIIGELYVFDTKNKEELVDFNKKRLYEQRKAIYRVPPKTI